VQTDNKVYTTDGIVWFKAIVTNAADHTASIVSGVLYVEVIDPNENIVERKLIKLQQGMGSGFFQLAPSYNYGVYQVRAYTGWNKNFGSGFFFKDYILVSGPERKAETNAIRSVTVIEGQRKERRLKLNLDPAAVDSLSGKDITLHVMLDKKKDTLSVKKNKSNQYVLDYTAPTDCRVVTLQVETGDQLHYAKTIVLDTSYLDLQFFPESGELVHGLPGLLGFKVLGYDGKGRHVEGEIVNSKGTTVSSFKTNRLGMGSVWLSRLDSTEKYTARIVSPVIKLSQVYSLPPIAGKGTILSVKKEEGNIRVKARSSFLADDSILVRASCRGVIHYDFKAKLKNGNFEYSLPATSLPEGIINFTLMTNLQTPLAERLYFNERPETRLNIIAAADKKTYAQREKTQLTIETKDSYGQPEPAHISLLVFNKSQQGSTLDLRQTILSYFLLSSDLKGEIEDPGFYFSQNSNRFNDLDALLLTQGWRKYKYTRDTINLRFQPEAYLAVSGNVKGGLSNKKIIEGADLTMTTFSKTPSFETQKTDSLGKFNFLLNDEYGPELNVLIQSSKASKQKNYLITLDAKETPPVLFDHIRSVEKPDSLVQAYIKQSVARKKAEDAYRAASEGHMLEEVIVKTRSLSAQQKLVTERYGEADVIISGKAIRDKEEKWSFGLYSILLYNFPDKVDIRTLRNGTLHATLFNNLVTLVVIDGIPVKHYEYSFIPSIQPSEVKSFEIIEYAKNFMSLYCDAAPNGCGPNSPSMGNVIAIYTNVGKGLSGVRPTVGIKTTAIPVFSYTREFYAPKYDQLKPEDWLKPDLRTLVHWAPNIKSDSTGKSSATFFNSDNTGTIQVVVEAISESGEIGYRELYFDVKKD
jgi:hypothetical protein